MAGLIDMNRWGTAPALFGGDVATGFGSEFSPLSSWGGVGSAGLNQWMNQPGAKTGIMGALRSSGFLGSDGGQGWGGLALGALSGLGNAFMGMQNYGLAKQGLADSREQFSKNYAAQRDTLNTQMEDRQRARVAANSGAESVESYMARNRIK